MSSTDSLTGHFPNKFTGESHAESKQRGWNPWPCINPCIYTLHHCTVMQLQYRKKSTYQIHSNYCSTYEIFLLYKRICVAPAKENEYVKGNLYSISCCVKETPKDSFCCVLFACPMLLTIQKEDGQATCATSFLRAFPWTSSMILISSGI